MENEGVKWYILVDFGVGGGGEAVVGGWAVVAFRHSNIFKNKLKKYLQLNMTIIFSSVLSFRFISIK